MWKAYLIENEFEITTFYSAFDRFCGEDFLFKGENHDFWEMVYVVDGSVLATADERVIRLSKNQLLFHRPMEFHTLRAYGQRPANVFIMSFATEGSYMDRFSRKIIHLEQSRSKELLNILNYMKEYNNIPVTVSAPSPVALLQKAKTDKCYAQKIKNLTEIFLINISSTQSEEGLFISSETKIYREAMNIIDESIFDNLTVSEIARRCNVSEAYLKKIFSKYAGVGVHNCVLKAKITYAKQMLDGGSSVSDIAEKLSFSGANYFSIVFKRETGMSPSAYKRR